MKVFMISGDPNVPDPQSDTAKRMAEYKEAFGELDILLAYGNVFRFVGAFFDGLRMILKKKPDIITAQDAEHALLAWIFSKLFRIPWQMQIHTDILSPYFKEQSLKNKIRVMLAKFLIPRADCIRVVSERIKNSLTAYGLQLKAELVVLPVFVDTETIKNAPIKTDLHQKYPSRFIILMASRITREKNIFMALEVMRGLTRNDTRTNAENVLLLIVGDGPERKSLQHMAYSLRLEDNVIFEANTADIASYFKTCDLFLLTSNYEGYGMTLVEAAAAGAKIISSDVGIAPEILDRENIFRVGDKDDLVEKLKSAIHGKIGLARLPAQKTKEEYLRLYKKSLEKCQKIF